MYFASAPCSICALYMQRLDLKINRTKSLFALGCKMCFGDTNTSGQTRHIATRVTSVRASKGPRTIIASTLSPVTQRRIQRISFYPTKRWTTLSPTRTSYRAYRRDVAKTTTAFHYKRYVVNCVLVVHVFSAVRL